MLREQNNLVSVSGNRCLVPRSVILVDASDSFDTILDVVRAGLYPDGRLTGFALATKLLRCTGGN